MNEALDILFQDAVSTGYKGTKDEFGNLLKTNPEARKIVFDDAVSTGYNGTFDDFNSLIGLTAQPVAVQPDKKKVATALPSAASSSGSVSTRPTEPTIATRKPQTTSFGTYGVSKPQPSTAPFTKPVAPEPESILGPVEKDMSVKREVSMIPTQPAMPKPAAPEPTAEESAYFRDRLSTVNTSLISKEEEYVVPQMNYQFGNLGFKFEEAGATGDYMDVTAPNGKQIQISLDNFSDEKSQAESIKLQEFIKNNTPAKGLFALEKNLKEEDRKFNSQKQIDDAVALADKSANDLVAKQKSILLEKDAFDKESAALQAIPESQRNTPEFIKRSNELESKRLALNEKIGSIVSEEESLKFKRSSLDKAIGKYSTYKAEQGTWGGAIWNSLMTGYGKISAGMTSKGIELLAEILPTDMQMSPDQLKQITSQKIASKLGIKPPAANQNIEDWKKTLTEEQLDAWEDEVDDYTKKQLKQQILPSTRVGLRTVVGDKDTSVEWENLKKEGFWGGALLGVTESLPAMAGGNWAVRTAMMFSRVSDGIEEEMANNPEFDNVSENEKLLVTLPIGIVGGVLEEFGLKNIKGASGVINKITMSVLGKAGKTVTAKTFKELVENEVESRIAKGLLVMTSAGLAEAETGAAQEAATIGIKEVYNKMKEKEMFDNPDSALDFVKQVSLAGAQEAVGGFVLGVPTAVSTAYSEKGFLKMNDVEFGTFESIANDTNLQNAFISKLKIDVSNGELTTEEAKTKLNDYRNAVGLYRQLPDGLNSQQKKEAMNLLKEKRDLEQYVNGKDKSLVKRQSDRINEIDQELVSISEKKEDYAVQESGTEEGVLRNEEPQVGLQEMGEGNAEEQATPQETIVQEEVTAEPLDQKSSRLLDAIDTARQAGADGIDALNSSLANLRGIASERVKQIGNRIDDLQQKVRDLTKSSTVPSATLSDLAGTQVNYNGESGTLNVSEGGAVTFETPNQIIEIENATPTSMAADFKIEAPKPAIEITPTTDRFIDNDNVVINDVEYGIQADDNGNVVGLQLKDGSNQVLTNPQLLVKAEAIRNTEGKVAITTETTITPEAQSQIDALNSQIDALTNERSRIEQATAEPVAAEATPTEKRFAGSVLAATRVVAEDLAKLVAILTKANKNVKVITDKQAMIDFLVSNGITPEQAAQVKGFRFGDKVYINPELATVDTPIHEFAHIWGELCKKQRPELWKRGISLITKSNYYKDLLARIKANPEMSKLYATPEAIKEEALIQAIGERGAVIFDDNKLQLLWNNWVNAFDNFVKKLLGLPLTADITKIKLSEFLDMAAAEVLTGKSMGVGGEMTIEKTKAAKNIEAQVEAWHGSPFRFDKFSLSKMGTGEGAQAFGWGLYFTDLESIARKYKSTLSKKANYELWLRDTTVENKIEELYEDLDRANISKYEFISNKISFLEELLSTWDYNKAIEIVNADPLVVRWADIHVKPFVENDLGNLYKVSLHEGKTPDQYTWLEWDKRLTDEQRNAILKQANLEGIALEEHTYPSGEKGVIIKGKDGNIKAIATNGKQMYEWLYQFSGGNVFKSDKDVSLFLLRAGIDGIKYPAESISSGATSDTARGFNYVVFDENAVKIQEAIQFQAQQSANDLAKIIKDAIKAKLTKTQIVDILVKRGGLTAAEANQAYNDVKAGNAISIATTGTTPAATTTTVKPKTKFVDNIANAIEQMAGGNVAPEVKDAIVKEMNNARQAIKKALMSEMALKKQLASIVKSLGVSNKITAAQAKSIITAFSKVNVMSDSSVNNFIDKVMDIFDKVNAKTEAENRSSLINKIADLAKKAARSAVTSTGKTRAKSLDAVGQSFFKQVNKIVTLAMNNDINGMAVIANDLANAQNEINDAVQKELNGEQLTSAESDLLDLVYAFDAFGDMLNMSEAELQALLDDLKDAKSTSIQSMKAFRHKQALEKKNIVNATDSKVKQLNPAMFNADGSLKGQEQRKQNRKEIRNELNKGKVFKAMKMYINSFDLKGVNGAIRTLANTIQNIETLSTILGKGKDKFFIKNIYDKLFVAEEKQRKGYQKNMNLMETLAKSVGFKNFDALVDSLTTGRQYEFEVNGQKSFYDKDELLRMYALSKNEEQRAKLKKQGIDDNALAEIKTILGPELVSFADKVVDYLSNTYYDETNSVYVSEYNTRLPRVKDYFPTITERTDTTADILSGDLSRIFMADTASALKRRVDKDSDVILSFGFINALEGHFQQIERFKAYAPTVREINSTFSSPAFSAYLDETGTKKLFKFLVSNAISPDAGNPFPTTKSSIFDKYAGFALAFKLIQIPKQAISAVAAFEDYQFRKGKYTPAVDLIMFIKDLTTTIATLPKQVKKAREISASFNERYVEGMKGNVISTTSGRGGLRSLKQRSGIFSKLYRRFKSLASLPTTFGDTLSVMGYMAVYNRNIKNGMDPEQAAIEFNNYNKTLQSRNAVDRTALQNNKEPLLKAFTMFGSSAFLQMNKVMQSSSAIVSKTAEYTKTRDASKLPSVKEYRAFMLNLGIANALFAWASYAFKILLGDDEDREKAYDEMMKALFGLNLLYQLPLLGDAIELVNAAIDGDELSLKGTGLNPYTTIAVKAIKGIKNDDYTQAAKPILELVSGMSFDPFIGLYEYFEGSEPTEESLYKVFGISKTYQPATSNLTQEDIDAMEAEDKKQMKEFDPSMYESVYGEEEREKKRIKAEEKALKELYGEEEED
jgi:hypothetical protein